MPALGAHPGQTSGVEVHIEHDPRAFAEQASGFLAAETFTANVIAVHLQAVLDGRRTHGTADLWALVRRPDPSAAVVGVAMHTPPHPVFVSRMPDPAAAALALTMSGLPGPVEGVNGESAAVAAFARAWGDATGRGASVLTKSRMYRLGTLTEPSRTVGHARCAGPGDGGVLDSWFRAFHDEATPTDPSGNLEAVADRRLRDREIWLWIDGERPVAMAAHSSPAKGVARIGPVYTPPRQRRRGYAAAVTAAATRAALGLRATQVVLYTDLSNPTANSVYQRIGFIPDHDAEHRRFH